MTARRTWILIADGARARLVAAHGHGSTLHLVEQREFHADHSPNRQLRRDKPVRVYESHGSARHGVEPKSDAHRELKRDFSQEIADALDLSLAQKMFDRLVVVAPPVTLGDLRGSLSEPVKAVVVAEVAADLTKVPNSEVPGHLNDVLPN